MKIFLFLSLIVFSCSKSPSTNSKNNLSSHQVKAQEVMQEHLKGIKSNGYDISDSEVDLLKESNLISEEELSLISIVK